MRRSARLQRAGALNPRDRMWAAIREIGAGAYAHAFSVAEIMVLSEQRLDTVAPYLTGLEKAGYIGPAVHQREPLRRVLQLYELRRDVGVEAPRVGRDGKPTNEGAGRKQMWNAMRANKGEFTKYDLCASASIGGSEIAVEEAKCYLQYLLKAGYVRLTRPCKLAAKNTPPQPAGYQFIRSRNTGPRAPMIDRAKRVIDGNTGDVMWQPVNKDLKND